MQPSFQMQPTLPVTETHSRRQAQESPSPAEEELGPEEGRACLATLRPLDPRLGFTFRPCSCRQLGVGLAVSSLCP